MTEPIVNDVTIRPTIQPQEASTQTTTNQASPAATSNIWGGYFNTGGMSPFGYGPSLWDMNMPFLSPTCFSGYNFLYNLSSLLSKAPLPTLMNNTTDTQGAPQNNLNNTGITPAGNTDILNSTNTNVSNNSLVENSPPVSQIPGVEYREGEYVFTKGANTLRQYVDAQGNTIVENYGQNNKMISKTTWKADGTHLAENYDSNGTKTLETLYYADGSYTSKRYSQVKNTTYRPGETVTLNNQGFLVKSYANKNVNVKEFYKNGKCTRVEFYNNSGHLILLDEGTTKTLFERNLQGGIIRRTQVQNAKSVNYIYDTVGTGNNRNYKSIRVTGPSNEVYNVNVQAPMITSMAMVIC